MFCAVAAILAPPSGATAAMILDAAQGAPFGESDPADGEAVPSWDNLVPGAADASQLDPALQPEIRIASGLVMVEFTGQEHLTVDAGADDLFEVIVVDVPASLAGQRVIVTRDTTAGTTKPAYSFALDTV